MMPTSPLQTSAVAPDSNVQPGVMQLGLLAVNAGRNGWEFGWEGDVERKGYVIS